MSSGPSSTVEPFDASGSPAPTAAALARASALNLAARVASGAAVFALTVISTNVLDTHGRGVYAILATWISIGVMITTSGTTVLSAELIYARHSERVLHGASSAIAVISAVVLLPLSVLVSELVGGTTLAAMLSAAAATVLLTYCCFELSIAQARGDVLRVSLTDIGMSLFPLVATAAAVALFDPTVTTLVAAWAVGALVMAAVLFAAAIPNGSPTIARAWGVGMSIMRRSAGVALANATTLLCQRIDVLVVAAVISVSAAGVYSISVALAVSLLLLSRSLLTATYHSIMTAPATEVSGRLGAALRHSVIVVLVAGGLSVPVVALAAGFVFGDAYAGIWRWYVILVPGSAFACVTEILRHFLLTRIERQREFLLVATAMLVMNCVLAVVGAATLGLAGAAASTTITYAVGAVALVGICARLVSVPMRELAVPRRSDLDSYGRVARAALARPRSTRSVTRP
jgi:O-antigen/teichoic acid export membrane protein